MTIHYVEGALVMTASARLDESRSSWFSRHELASFFTLAFVVSWAAWPLVLLNPTSSPLVPFGPLVAALVVTAVVGGRRYSWELLRKLGRWRVDAIWYVVALLGPFVLIGVAGALAVASGAPAPGVDEFAGWSAVPVTLVSTVLIVGLFEELGWRGYALPLLHRDHGALWSAVVLGAIWAVWHLPELISDPSRARPPVPFIAYVFALSVVLAWLYNRTGGSVPLVMIFHAAGNTAAQYVLPMFVGAYYLTVWWALVAVYLASAVAVVVYERRSPPTGNGDAVTLRRRSRNAGPDQA